ncbi:hypothetical protein [Reyranella sp.]|uniref:hypothetical protein n=1 Tax=Reyranella sp. TaxID=1929291 RepID=UPI003D0A7969
MSAAHAAAAASTADELPVLRALETWHGTLFGRTQPGLDGIARIALAPTTRKLQLGPLGSPYDHYYPDVPDRSVSLPLWCEGVAPLRPPADASENAANDFLEDAVFSAFYGNTPVGMLLTWDEGEVYAVSASFIALPLPDFPLGAEARVVVDMSQTRKRGENDGHASVLYLADFYRAKLGLPLAAKVSPADLLVGETRATLDANGRWIRTHLGKELPRRVIKEPHASNCVAGVKTLRSAHARTYVEVVPHKLGKEEIAYLAENGTSYLGEAGATPFYGERIFDVIGSGPFLAMSAIEKAAKIGRKQ